ncbi:probable serine/threonine-protein kinase irlB [Mytilus edulis]|uniref:probable serine/threonine-protein kinase irlB n=1 Tax=Mytilus edulis TaxID=6550 RepID=UPI0039EE09E8
MNQNMKELSMDEDNAIFERNLNGFILSVLHAACSETESDAVSVQQTMNTDTASEEERVAFFGNARTKEFGRLSATMKEENDEAENTETASEKERIAFFGDVRTKEFERLTATFEEQNAEAENTETASEDELIAFFGAARLKELDILMSTLNTQVDKVENQEIQAKPLIITEKVLPKQVETEALDTEETASEEDRIAFFQSVRDEERQKLIEAFAREKKWKEERDERREKKRQEQIRKMFEDFHKPAVSPLSPSYEPGPSKEQYHLYPSSSNTEYNIILKSSVSKLHERVKAFTEEQKDLQRKLELSHATNPRADTDENKEKSHISIRTKSDAEILKADRTNDVKKTGPVWSFVNRIFKRSKSTTADISTKPVDPEELKLDLSLLDDNREKEEDQPDTARTSNSEWCTLSDIEEPPRPRLKPFFTPPKETHETTVSKSTSHKVTESMNQFLLNEPTKSDPTEIPVHSGSIGRFQRFRKQFKRLFCCCCSQNVEDRDTVCS